MAAFVHVVSYESDITAISRSILACYADTRWTECDETRYKRTNLEEWVRLNRIESILGRTTILDVFSDLIKSYKKSLRSSTPFKRLSELGAEEIGENDNTENYSKICEDILDRRAQVYTEPWMIPEVEEKFKLLSGRFFTSAKIDEYDLEEKGFISNARCGRLCPFYQTKSIKHPFIENTKQKSNYSDAHGEHRSSATAESGVKENEVESEEPSECHFKTHHSKSSSHRPGQSEILGALLDPVTDDDIKRFPVPSCLIGNLEELKLYSKISSECVRNIWKKKPTVAKDNALRNKSEALTGSNHPYKRYLLPRKSQSTQITHSVNSNGNIAIPKQLENSPLKSPGLNAEVPEFFPRKEDIYVRFEFEQRIISPTSVAESERNVFSYFTSELSGNKCNQSSIPLTNTVNSFSTPNTYISPGIHNLQAPISTQFNFYNQMAHQYPTQNYPNQHQVIPPPLQNNLVPSQQITMLSNQPVVYQTTESQQVNEYDNIHARTMQNQQAWVNNILYRNHYQQQLQNQQQMQNHQQIQNKHQLQNQQLTQLVKPLYSNQPLHCPQQHVSESMNQFTPKTLNEPLFHTAVPQMNQGFQNSSLKQRVENTGFQYNSPPKNIPVFQRPPESYSQGDGNNRRRNGASGGGGGVVLSNLIVLTKGRSRWKGTKSLHPSTGEPQTKGIAQEREKNTENAELTRINNILNELSEETSVNEAPKNFLSTSLDDTFPMSSFSEMQDESSSKQSATEKSFKDSDVSEESFLRNGDQGIFPGMTSTPKKLKKGKKEKREPLKWLDIATSSTGIRENLLFDSPTSSLNPSRVFSPGTSSKNLQESQSNDSDLLSGFSVKACSSDPSFPPIRAFCSRTKRQNQSDVSSKPYSSGSTSERPLYRDVLAPRHSSVFLGNSSLVVDASSSVDSLERQFVELERMAVEQYRSSEESISNIYHDLEMEAIEQYRSSSESEGRVLVDKSSTSLNDKRLELVERRENLTLSRSLGDVKEGTSQCVTSDGQERSINCTPPPSPHKQVMIIMKTKAENSYSSVANGDSSSSDDENGPKNKMLSNGAALSHEIVSRDRKKVDEGGDLPENDHSDKGQALKCIPCEKKITLADNATGAELSTTGSTHCPLSVDKRTVSTDNHAIVQQENPNEKRTQVSYLAGNKSEGKKEDLADSVMVPGAWVPQSLSKETLDKNGKFGDGSLKFAVIIKDGKMCETNSNNKSKKKRRRGGGKKKKKRQRQAQYNLDMCLNAALNCAKNSSDGTVVVKHNGNVIDVKHAVEESLRKQVNQNNDVIVCKEIKGCIWKNVEVIPKLRMNFLDALPASHAAVNDEQAFKSIKSMNETSERIFEKYRFCNNDYVVQSLKIDEFENSMDTTNPTLHKENKLNDDCEVSEKQESEEYMNLSTTNVVEGNKAEDDLVKAQCIQENLISNEGLGSKDGCEKCLVAFDYYPSCHSTSMEDLERNSLPQDQTGRPPEQLKDFTTKSISTNPSVLVNNKYTVSPMSFGKITSCVNSYSSLKTSLLASSPRISGARTLRASHYSESSSSSSSSLSRLIRRGKKTRKVKNSQGNDSVASSPPSCNLQ